jgi:hypothetical protein
MWMISVHSTLGDAAERADRSGASMSLLEAVAPAKKDCRASSLTNFFR